MMRRLVLMSLAVAGLAGVATTSATAMPVAAPATFEHATMAQNVRLVCDEVGRCWRTGPRYRVVRRYYDEPRYYGPSYSYAPAYGYYGGPSYGYGWGGPSVGIGFGFGRRGW